jgi:Rrf2 family nitric oxide-sensitive transcriptional repressor
MKLTKLTDYALIILCEMNGDNVLPVSKISEKTKIPFATTNKILRLLSVAGICSPKSGKQGGFILLKKKSEISLLNVILAIEGKTFSLIECSSPESKCQLLGNCKISKKISIIDKEIFTILNKKFISDLN